MVFSKRQEIFFVVRRSLSAKKKLCNTKKTEAATSLLRTHGISGSIPQWNSSHGGTPSSLGLRMKGYAPTISLRQRGTTSQRVTLCVASSWPRRNDGRRWKLHTKIHVYVELLYTTICIFHHISLSILLFIVFIYLHMYSAGEWSSLFRIFHDISKFDVGDSEWQYRRLIDTLVHVGSQAIMSSHMSSSSPYLFPRCLMSADAMTAHIAVLFFGFHWNFPSSPSWTASTQPWRFFAVGGTHEREYPL